MILLLPLFGKHLEKAELLAWKANIINKAKEKRSCLKPTDISFFIFCHFWKIDPHFPSSLQSWPPLSVFSSILSFTFRPIFGPTPTNFQSTYNDLQPPNFSLTEVASLPRAFRTSQKDCPSLYHALIRLCFNKIVRRNIHFSVISHSLCNRKVILFSVICISHS